MKGMTPALKAARVIDPAETVGQAGHPGGTQADPRFPVGCQKARIYGFSRGLRAAGAGSATVRARRASAADGLTGTGFGVEPSRQPPPVRRQTGLLPTGYRLAARQTAPRNSTGSTKVSGSTGRWPYYCGRSIPSRCPHGDRTRDPGSGTCRGSRNRALSAIRYRRSYL